MNTILANRPPMTDQQRRAMFARMHGGGSHSGVPTSGNSADGSSQSLEKPGALSGAELAALPPWDPRYQDAGGVSGAESDFAFLLPATRAAQTFAGNIYKGLGSFGKTLASWKTPVAAAVTAHSIGKVRDALPTMDPRTEKVLAITQQISSYVASVSGLGAGKQAIATAMPETVAKTSTLMKDLGEAISLSSETLAEKIPAAIKTPLAKIHGGYTKIADMTGASWSDVMNAPKIRTFLAKAKSLRDAATAARSQADDIESAARDLRIIEQNKATDILQASHKGSLVDWESAQRMYGEGAAKWYAAEYGAAASKKTARLMREQAVKMEEQAATVTQDAYNSAVKAALVVAGFTAKELHEESKIADYKQQMEAAWSQGESFTLPAEKPRDALGTAAAFVTGTLGNPIEKQTRYGADSYVASVANYRAQYDAIAKAEISGELTADEAATMRTQLVKEKPWNMAGKGPWTFAPAAAAFISWQAGNISDYFAHEVEVGTVTKVLDGDTIEVAGKKIRMLGMDTPESVHPDKSVEYLGPEASHYQKDNLSGKTARLVRSKGVTTDKYGRDLAYVETLPGPLDSLFTIPGIGQWIPGVDQNKKMIDLGFGQPRYLELSGGHERQKEYDKAVERAKTAGVGVWSPEGLQQLDYHYTPKSGSGSSTTPLSDIGNLLGSGLMITGQSGALKAMGTAGNAIAQVWNASLAGIGVADYNARANARTNAVAFRPSKSLKTDYEKHAESVLKERHPSTRSK